MTEVHHTAEALRMITAAAVHQPEAVTAEAQVHSRQEVHQAEVTAEALVHQGDTEDNRTT